MSCLTFTNLRLLCCLLWTLFMVMPGDGAPADEEEVAPRRIISTAPSLTEILFELGAGDRVVGVSTYCHYPEQVRHLPRIGGLYDPHYEGLIRLDPDLVVTFDDNRQTLTGLQRLGLRTVAVRHETVDDILESVHIIGQAVGRTTAAEALTASMRSSLHKAAGKNRTDRPRVLVAISRQNWGQGLHHLYIAGTDNFHHELIELAGGANAYDGPLPYPSVTMEGLLAMAPDVIIDIIPPEAAAQTDHRKLAADWALLSEAGHQPRIAILSNDYAAVPGPRITRLLHDFAKAIHDE